MLAKHKICTTISRKGSGQILSSFCYLFVVAKGCMDGIVLVGKAREVFSAITVEQISQWSSCFESV